jgi:4-fold beta flower protein
MRSGSLPEPESTSVAVGRGDEAGRRLNLGSVNAQHLFGSKGQYLAFVDRWNVFASNGAYVGFLRESRVFNADGAYVGIIRGDRLLRETAAPKHKPEHRPLKPHAAPKMPVDPFGRSPITLPAGFVDLRL